MDSKSSRIYTNLLNTLTISELQLIYDEAMSDLEETEYLHSSLLGLDKDQKEDYEELKNDLSIYSILEDKSQEMAAISPYM